MKKPGGPWLWLSPKMAHDLGPIGLNLWSKFLSQKNNSWRALDWRGLHFRNPLGIAGGVDKTGDSLKAWHKFGCGFLEIGTVTPISQTANPGMILDRDIQTLSVWNKMGFPGPGADDVAKKLNSLSISRPLFINIGKNRSTSNEVAAQDYVACFEKLYRFADAFVVNISSPNTSGLRQLSSQNFLDQLLNELTLAQVKAKTKIPILLKLSPDMTESEMLNLIDRSAAAHIDGWILTNTTLARDTGSKFQTEGGVSGAPLSNVSKLRLQQAVKYLGEAKQDRLLISAGGVMTPQDVEERLELGADLIQVYSTLIFHGPLFFRDVAKYFDKDHRKI